MMSGMFFSSDRRPTLSRIGRSRVSMPRLVKVVVEDFCGEKSAGSTATGMRSILSAGTPMATSLSREAGENANTRSTER